MKKFLGRLKWVLIVLAILVIVMAIAFKTYTGNYYKADSNIINVVKNLFDDTVHSYSNHNGKVFVPVNQKPKAVIVFYPGGKVEYTAYDSLMYAIASKGYCCLLPKMPENLAFFRIDAAKKITKGYEKDKELVEDVDWYLAGHSLGGVAAAQYLKDMIDENSYAGILQPNMIPET